MASSADSSVGRLVDSPLPAVSSPSEPALPAPRRQALALLAAAAAPRTDEGRLAALLDAEPRLAGTLRALAVATRRDAGPAVADDGRVTAASRRRSLRHLLLCVCARDAMAGDHVHGQDATAFRDAALRRAVAARVLAEHVGADPEECFALGLVQDLGLLAMFHAHPERAGCWSSMPALDPIERHEREHELFGIGHDEFGAVLAREWQAPERLAEAVSSHHRAPAGAGDTDHLRRIARSADWMAWVFEPGDERRRVRGVREALVSEWGLSAVEADDLLDEVSDAVAEAAAALELPIPGPRPYREVLREAELVPAGQRPGPRELDRRLERALTERDAATAALAVELEKARVVQRALLPATGREPGAAADRDCPFHGINAVAGELSGDFHDFFRLADGRWCFCIADVPGKGMDAVLTMVRAASAYRALARTVHDPGRLLTMLNAELCERPVRGMFVSMAAGLLDPRDGALQLVNAGHPPLLAVSAAGAVDVVPAHGPPLGVVPGGDFRSVPYALGDGTLYAFTDGLVEASGDGERFGYAGVVDLVRRFATLPAAERLARMLAAASSGHGISRDDITMLLLEGRRSPAGR